MNLSKRRFLNAGTALGLALAVCGPAAAADPIKLRIGWPSPMVGPHGAGAKAFAWPRVASRPSSFRAARSAASARWWRRCSSARRRWQSPVPR